MDVTAVTLIRYQAKGDDETIPAGEYLEYAAGQEATRLALGDGPMNTLNAEPTDQFTALFNVLTREGSVNPTMGSRLPSPQ